ncbi:MAG TPA: cytosine permease [Nocardioides sp.]|jgi:purine-cytosine permease-like protein|uniref:purine-cytosine permease family protein n=1 Tax=Nocardioides sp. TaxID=35761 RepID=UPI002E369C97|nr:cytosine permease [Nocardioides sp.]HEX3932241.1 cytosine permease [Nocardioides sp.]
MTAIDESSTRKAPPAPSGIEANGINVIDESERKGAPADLFWPWCASNISVLAVSYGAFVLGYGIGFAQAVVAGVVGIVVGFFLVGLVSIAGKRGSAPTLVLSRAPFGRYGNTLPGIVSYLLLVGWETVLVALSTKAVATVFAQLGWSSGNAVKIVAFLVVAAAIVGAGVLGFDAIMRIQRWLTIAMVIVTAVYIALTLDKIHLHSATSLKSGTTAAVIGATILVLTGFGLGWVNTAADYSRYLPRSTRAGGVVFWPTFGGSLPVVVLVGFGLLLCASSSSLNAAVQNDPIGGLASVLPNWFLVPFVLVSVAGLISGAMLDLYSSGLTLLSLGLRTPRYVAAGVDGVLMVLGTIYIVWVSADNFLGIFEGFLITLGVPMAAWCGIFLADLWLRRRDYDEPALFAAEGRYGAVGWPAFAVMVVATAIGWGLVVQPYGAKGLGWLGYLLGAGFGGKTGTWSGASLGVPIALAIGVVGYLLLGAARVRAQER